jgi:multidrug resistance efflux pump
MARLEAADLAAEARQADAALAAARAALAQARTGLEIQRTQSATRVAQAAAARSAAREQLSLVREGARRPEKRQADETVRQAEAGKAQAEESVQQAKAALAAAQAHYSLVREGARRQQKLQADAALRQADASLRTAEATYQRYRRLHEEGAVSALRFDEVALQRDVAQAQYETAQQQALMVHEGARSQELQQAEEAVRQAESLSRIAEQKAREAEAAQAAAMARRDLTYEGARAQEIRQAEAQVRQAEEALRMARAATSEDRIKTDAVRMLLAQVQQAEAHRLAARVQLSYATLVAPFGGVIVQRHLDPGALATAGVPLLTLVDAKAFRFDAPVPESRISTLRVGDPTRVALDSLGRTLPGRIVRIVPSADPTTRTFLAKIALPPVAGLSDGLFGRARFQVGRSRTLIVPAAALWRAESLVGVVVVEAGIAHKRLVTMGRALDGGFEVLSGLRSGEVIVARDPWRVEDGAAVQPEGGRS